METPNQRTLNAAEGFLCPHCQQFRIRLSLEDFLSRSDVRCGRCGMQFHMDKTQCTELLGLLQELHVAQKNVRLLSRQSL
jgi:transcription elongation factor Elf1